MLNWSKKKSGTGEVGSTPPGLRCMCRTSREARPRRPSSGKSNLSLGWIIQPPVKQRRQTGAIFSARGGASREARTETFVEFLPVEVPANEDERVVARLVAPFAVGATIHQHVHALENEAHLAALHRQNALHAENILAFRAQQRAEPVGELLFIEIARRANPDGGHVLGMMMVMLLVLVFIMPVSLMVMVLMIVVVIMVVLGRFEEIGLELERAFQI